MNTFKNASIISIATIVSQALGVLRDKLLISIVGVGVTLDIYNAGFKIPDFINAIFLSFVGLTVMVPYLTSSLIKNDKLELEKKVSTVFYFFNACLILASIFIIFTLDLFLVKLFPNFSASEITTLSHITKLMLIQPILLGSSNLITCVAQANKIFSYYAISPIFYNMGIIIGILFFYKNYGIYGLIYGVLLGAFFHFAISFIYLIKHKVDINLKYFDFRFIREIFPIVAWRSIAFIVMSVKQFVLTVFAGFLGVGIISSFTFAFNLTNMAVQFFATSYAVAAFPLLSEYFERGEFEKLKKTIKSNISKLLGVSIIFSVILFVFAKLIVSIIYNGDVRVLNIFYILIFAIPMLSIEQYYARAFMAMGKVKLVSAMQVVSLFILCLTLTILYKNGSDYTLLAKGYLITITLQTFILIIISRFYKLF